VFDGEMAAVKEIERILAQRVPPADPAVAAAGPATAPHIGIFQTSPSGPTPSLTCCGIVADALPPSERAPIPADACEYLVKWKNLSYIHTEWVPAARILSDGVAGRSKISRFVKAQERKVRSICCRFRCVCV
jgi:hypothetical protein